MDEEKKSWSTEESSEDESLERERKGKQTILGRNFCFSRLLSRSDSFLFQLSLSLIHLGKGKVKERVLTMRGESKERVSEKAEELRQEVIQTRQTSEKSKVSSPKNFT